MRVFGCLAYALLPKKQTPYEAWHARKPRVDHVRVFGCLAYAHVPSQHRPKLDSKATKCIFIGYSPDSKAYRLVNPVTNKVITSRDVIFDEKFSPSFG